MWIQEGQSVLLAPYNNNLHEPYLENSYYMVLMYMISGDVNTSKNALKFRSRTRT